MELELQKFIRSHNDWEKILQNEPYCLEIKRDIVDDKHLILFKYNQISSDFSNKIVCECRGLVLDEDTFELVVFPFTKFFNSGEKYADKIDWNTAKVTQKLDGSLCKIVKIGANDILIGTNGTIDASKAPLAEQIGCKAKSFGDLVLEGLAYYSLNEEMLATMLEENKTYMFELCSPYNQVVVRWPETKLFFIGVRDNKTFKEENFEDHFLADVFDTPKIYDMHSIEDCIKAANELPDSEEGYVVRDANFKRVKIKSPKYLSLHRLSGNGILSIERGLEIVKANEIDEVVSYFPAFKHDLDMIKSKYENALREIDESIETLKKLDMKDHVMSQWSRKDLAIYIKENFKIPSVGFLFIDKKIDCAKDWASNCATKSLMQYIGLKDLN